MTKTYSLSTTRTAMIAFLFVMLASLAYAMPASADVNGAPQQTLDQRLASLKAKIAELEVKKNDLMTLLEKVKASTALSSPNSSGLGDWKNRLCKSGGSMSNVAIPKAVRDRLCDKDKHGTSTPSVPKPPVTTSASSGLATSTFKILEPNGGELYVYRLDTGGGASHNAPDLAQFIHYTTPKGMMSVDISLIKIGTTTSTHEKPAYGSDFIWGKGIHTTYQGYAHLGTVKLSGKGGKQERFRWKAAYAGDGYKIVITGKVDGVTYRDESDNIFSMISVVNYKDRAPAGGLNKGKP